MLTIDGLQIAGTYYFAVKSYDEFGNASPISNIASGTTQDNDWRFMTVWPGHDVANSVGAAINQSGGWSFVSDDDRGDLRFLTTSLEMDITIWKQSRQSRAEPRSFMTPLGHLPSLISRPGSYTLRKRPPVPGPSRPSRTAIS